VLRSPRWLVVTAQVAFVVDVALGLLAWFVSPLFWLPAVALSVAVAYVAIVAKGGVTRR
jgi:hypothetical protein